MRPVYWKPKYGSRASRQRAWVRQQARRDEALRRMRGPSLVERLRRLLHR